MNFFWFNFPYILENVILKMQFGKCEITIPGSVYKACATQFYGECGGAG